jgi:cobyrinic acid a,c-diamide synthase
MPRRILIAGTQSGVGKTTITAGLIAALRARGLSVQPFKVGPDYIDPTYHALAAGRACRNLDTWMLPPESVRSLFARATRDADIAVIEGVMGVFDGCNYEEEIGSSAEVAKLLDAPVVLVLDVAKVARSAAAIALGYRQFDPDLPLAGFILNRVGSAGHGEGVARAVEQATGLPVLGWLPREPRVQVPERHLGLIPTAEPGRWEEVVRAAGEWVDANLDLDRLLAIANVQELNPAESHSVRSAACGLAERDSTSRPRIAVARDEAFHFTYEDNLDLLRSAGAELVFFSPVHDRELPRDTHALILSGGFPEVYADRLAANVDMHRALREAHAAGVPIYAECGGLMYLTQEIVTQEGRSYPMVGLLPGRSVMTGRLTLGYRIARAAADSWLLRAGETIRGHEFHYSVWENRPTSVEPAFLVTAPRGGITDQTEGACIGNLWASYVHLHFCARPELAERFVSAAIGAPAW